MDPISSLKIPAYTLHNATQPMDPQGFLTPFKNTLTKQKAVEMAIGAYLMF